MRFIVLVGIVLASFVVGPLVAGPTSQTIVASSALTGRTHLIVKELGIKRFTTGSLPISTLASYPCFPVSRTGVVSATPYTVPAGKVLVITDVQVATFPASVAYLDTPEGTFGYAFGTGTTATQSTHLTGGLALDAGTPLAVLSTGGSPGVIHVLGYETEDLP